MAADPRLLREALQAVARVEAVSTALASPRSARFALTDAGAQRVGRAWPGVRLRRSRRDDVVVARSSADRLLLGEVDPQRQLRARALYPGHRPAVTLAVHAREGDKPTRLAAAAEALTKLEGKAAFVAPAALEHGTVEGFDYLVETLLVGAPPQDEQSKQTAAATLLPQLLDTYAAVGIDPLPIASQFPARVRERIDALLGTYPWQPQWRDRASLRADLSDLVASDAPLAASLGHGDLVLSNVLLTDQWQVGLVDWEHAGHRPVGFDLAKLVSAAPDVDAMLEVALPRGDDLSPAASPRFAVQLALGLLRFQASWRTRLERAERLGVLEGYHQRMRLQLGLIDRLTRKG